MNNRHPWPLKKSKSWGPFWSYQLNSTANSANSPWKWAKLSELAGNSTTPKNCVLTNFLHERSIIFLLVFSLIRFWILLRNGICCYNFPNFPWENIFILWNTKYFFFSWQRNYNCVENYFFNGVLQNKLQDYNM